MDEKCQFLSLYASYLPIQVLKTSLIKTGIFVNETSQVERKEKVQLSALEATSTSTSAHWPKFY
jgi:hypothetical protein